MCMKARVRFEPLVDFIRACLRFLLLQVKALAADSQHGPLFKLLSIYLSGTVKVSGATGTLFCFFPLPLAPSPALLVLLLPSLACQCWHPPTLQPCR